MKQYRDSSYFYQYLSFIFETWQSWLFWSLKQYKVLQFQTILMISYDEALGLKLSVRDLIYY